MEASDFRQVARDRVTFLGLVKTVFCASKALSMVDSLKRIRFEVRFVKEGRQNLLRWLPDSIMLYIIRGMHLD
jgi:hypothetical protein